MSREKIVQTAGRNALGDFAPDFAHFNDDILFGENWNNKDIDLKTHSIVTVCVFLGRGLCDSSLKFHLETAKKNGVTKKEIAAIITHAAFYAGWPVAWAAFNMAKEVWKEEAQSNDEKSAYANSIFFPIGEPNIAYAQYFDGQSYLATVSNEQVNIANVTFEPGCRNHWHIHHASSGGGQMLVCVGGRGYYQEWGKDPIEMNPGDVIHIPAEVKHWHGAAPNSWFSHLAFEIDGKDLSNEWCESVNEEDYLKLK